MNILRLTPYPLIALIIIGCVGCATVQKPEAENEQLGARFIELKRSLDETNARLDDLNNKFVLLHEKVESTKEKVRLLEGVPAAPPEGLSVISLDGAISGIKPRKKPGPGETAAKDREDAKAPVASKKTKSTTKARAPERIPRTEDAPGLYNRGQDLFMAGDYAGARAAFKDFVDRYPGHTLTDNALYWLGEAYYSEQDYHSAVLVFEVVADKYPAENKAPDALLKLGYSYIELEELSKARLTLDALFSRYPKSEAARRGRQKYQELFG